MPRHRADGAHDDASSRTPSRARRHPADSVASARLAARTHPRRSRALNDTIRDFIDKLGLGLGRGRDHAWNVRAAATSSPASRTSRPTPRSRSDLVERARSDSPTTSSRRRPRHRRASRPTTSSSRATSASRSRRCATSASATSSRRLERLRAQAARRGPVRPRPQEAACPSSRTSSDSSPARIRMPRRTCSATPSCAGRTCGSASSTPPCRATGACPRRSPRSKALDADPEVDVIVIARGGGDPQTLLGFSDERLLRAVAAASTPVVSAIGHENDHPLLDDVADLRASTPTDAAKRVVPDVAEQRAIVAPAARAADRSRLTQRVAHDIAQLEQLRSRPVLRDPESMHRRPRSQELWLLVARGRDSDRPARSTRGTTAHGELRASLRALSPAAHPRPRLRDRAPRRRRDRAGRRAGPAGHRRSSSRSAAARSPRAPRARSPRSSGEAGRRSPSAVGWSA